MLTDSVNVGDGFESLAYRRWATMSKQLLVILYSSIQNRACGIRWERLRTKGLVIRD